jgi:hypothetical protein
MLHICILYVVCMSWAWVGDRLGLGNTVGLGTGWDISYILYVHIYVRIYVRAGVPAGSHRSYV